MESCYTSNYLSCTKFVDSIWRKKKKNRKISRKYLDCLKVPKLSWKLLFFETFYDDLFFSSFFLFIHITELQESRNFSVFNLYFGCFWFTPFWFMYVCPKPNLVCSHEYSSDIVHLIDIKLSIHFAYNLTNVRV